MAGVLLVISLVLHECGHVFAARLLQVETKAMGLCCMGAFPRRERAARPSDELTIALAGPCTNLLVMWTAIPFGHVGLWLAEMNLILFMTNLLPTPGTDGWRVLTSLGRAVMQLS